MNFTDWFQLNKTLLSQDGINIEVYSFNYDEHNQSIMSEWASRFRNNYCLDELIDSYRDGLGLSREEYLIKKAFPDKTNDFGPATRSGDFSEILISDFLQFIENYWIPSRIRYENKATRNSSTPGSDVVAIKFADSTLNSPQDELFVIESKGSFTGKDVMKQLFEIIAKSEHELDNRLQDAVDHSNKDPTRIGEFLNFAKVRFINYHNLNDAIKIQRFQNEFERPYKKSFGAAAFLDEKLYDDLIVSRTNCSDHSCKDCLRLFVFTGKDMMKLVHSLYERAAHEA